MTHSPFVTVNPTLLVRQLALPARAEPSLRQSDLNALLDMLSTAQALTPPPGRPSPLLGLLEMIERDVDKLRREFGARGMMFWPGHVCLNFSLAAQPLNADLIGSLSFEVLGEASMTGPGKFTVPLERLAYLALCVPQPGILAFCQHLHRGRDPGQVLLDVPFDTLPRPSDQPHAAEWLACALTNAVQAQIRQEADLAEWEGVARAAERRAGLQGKGLCLGLAVTLGIVGLLTFQNASNDFLRLWYALLLFISFVPYFWPRRPLPQLYGAAHPRFSRQHRDALETRAQILARPDLTAELTQTAPHATLSLRAHPRPTVETAGQRLDSAEAVQRLGLAQDQPRLLAAGQRLESLARALPGDHQSQARIAAMTAQLGELHTQIQERLTPPELSVDTELDELQRELDTQAHYLRSLPKLAK